MPTTYRLEFDPARSGPGVSITGAETLMPSPAVVKATRTGDDLTYELTFELVGGAWPVVTAICVRTDQKPSRSITATALRDMRFGQLQRACVTHLRRGARAGNWGIETLTLFEPEDDRESLSAHLPDIEKLDGASENDWADHLPPLVFDERSESKFAFRAEPGWLAQIKEGGARSDVALKATAAIYRDAVNDGRGSPNGQVARLLELPKSTASEWIRKARDRGYLEQSPRKTRSDRRGDDA